MRCVAVFVLDDLFRGSACNDLTTLLATFRTNIDDMIYGFYHVKIMFDNYYCIPFFDQFIQH